MGSDSTRGRRQRAGRRRDRTTARRIERMPRRATDRAEDVAAWLLIAVGLLLVLLIGSVAAAVHRDGVARARTEAAERHQVPATLLSAAAATTIRRPQDVRLVQWVGVDGAPVTDRVPVGPLRAGAAPGDQISIWLDRHGRATRPPTTAAAAAEAAVTTAAGLGLAGSALLGGLWAGVRALTARCNAARWEREWARVGPLWSRRVH